MINEFRIGEFDVWKDDAGFILIASRDRASKDEKWIINSLDSNQAKRFLEYLRQVIKS